MQHMLTARALFDSSTHRSLALALLGALLVRCGALVFVGVIAGSAHEPAIAAGAITCFPDNTRAWPNFHAAGTTVQALRMLIITVVAFVTNVAVVACVEERGHRFQRPNVPAVQHHRNQMLTGITTLVEYVAEHLLR